MVMPAGFLKFTCKSCGWSKIHYQHSDVLDGCPVHCPKCGEEVWRNAEPAGVTDIIKSLLSSGKGKAKKS